MLPLAQARWCNPRLLIRLRTQIALTYRARSLLQNFQILPCTISSLYRSRLCRSRVAETTLVRHMASKVNLYSAYSKKSLMRLMANVKLQTFNEYKTFNKFFDYDYEHKLG